MPVDGNIHDRILLEAIKQTELLEKILLKLETLDFKEVLTMPINSYGEGIGDAIQGQLVRGQRGIDQYDRS